MRFCNWLHNGQPTGAQDNSTTESGVYTVSLPPSFISRMAGARWFLPTESEWYKAAYYQPAVQGGDADGYWTYPTRSNTAPYSDQPPGIDAPIQANAANLFMNDGIANGYDDGYAVTGADIYDPAQNFLTDAGAYTQSRSFYGTYDQAGNVSEITETRHRNQNQTVFHMRGGNFDGGGSSVDEYLAFGIQAQLNVIGFRVAGIATVPEPSTLALAALGMLGLLIAARRKC